MFAHSISHSKPRRRRSGAITSVRLLPLFALLFIFLGVTQIVAVELTHAQSHHVDKITIDGTITPVMARYLGRAIEDAENDGAAALIVELDTPGGLSSAMEDMIDDILESEVPVVVYVAPRGARAASAGVYITYAAHVAAMAPGTNIGSASPVFLDETGSVTDGSETLQNKVMNDAISQITNLANYRGRNAEWAVDSVKNAANITADEALQLNVIDYEEPDLESLLNAMDGMTVQMENGTATLETAGAEVDTIEMGLLEGFLQLLAEPTIAYLLVSFGMLGLFIELSHPGVIVPGVVGGLALLLGLYALGTLPVNWTGVLLIIFGFILFAADLYVPSFGTLTIGGIISFVIGSYLLVESDAPPGFEISRPVIWTMTACLIVFFLWLAALVMRTRLKPPYTGKQALIGEVGEVRQSLNPSGMVYVYGELWSATTDDGMGYLPAGTPVTVSDVQGMKLRVRRATEQELSHEIARRAAAQAYPTARASRVGEQSSSRVAEQSSKV
jgi:membrane-bound serine protease (ClpP class)